MLSNQKKKPKGGELTAAEKARNREISSIRIRVEHVISSVKRYRIVKDKFRNWKQGFSDMQMHRNLYKRQKTL